MSTSVPVVVPDRVAPTLPPTNLAAESLHTEFLRQARVASWNTWQLLVLIRRMDACEGHEHFGCTTLAHYLELVCGITGVAARERIRVAFALESLPALEGALRCGELSYSKVRAVTRVATAETEGEWLRAARERTAEELEVMAARATRGEPVRRRLLTKAVNAHTTRMVVDLPAEEMMVVMRALERIRREAGGSLSGSEALVYLAADSLSGEVGEVRTAERYEVVVHVGEDGGSWVETDDAAGEAPLPREVVERLLCDCALRVVREGKEGLAASRRTRSVPEVTRRAVALRDGHRCRVPGCRRRLWLDLHHLVPVWEGGRHVRSNLVYLCRFHHQLVHAGLLRCERQDGELRFITVRGERWVLGEAGAIEDEEFWEWLREAEAGECAPETMEAVTTSGGDPEELRSTYYRARHRRPWQARERRAAYHVPAETTALHRSAGTSTAGWTSAASRTGSLTP